MNHAPFRACVRSAFPSRARKEAVRRRGQDRSLTGAARSNRRPLPRPRTRAFTLVEVVLALGIMTILMGAMASALVIVARAVPDGTSPREAVADGAAAVDQIAAELHTAIAVSSRTDASITFTVPDRTGDGVDDTIAYQWSGTPGDPLERQFNGGGVEEFVADVHYLELLYDVTTNTEQRPVEVESAESQLSGFTSLVSVSDFAITPTNWTAQTFQPNLSPGAISWSITRAKFRAAWGDFVLDGILGVELRPVAPTGKPTATAIEQVTILESGLQWYQTWREVYFTNANGLAPDAAMCLVFKDNLGSGTTCKINYRRPSGGINATSATMWATYDAGMTWTVAALSLIYAVYGTETTTSLQDVTVPYLVGVNIALQAGPGASSRVETVAPLLNTPEVS